MIYITPIEIILATNVLWQIGGQLSKGARRFGVPGFAVLSLFINDMYAKNKDKRKRYLPLLLFLLVPILCMGYGMNSALMKIFKKEKIVRAVYAGLLSIAFMGLPWFLYLIGLVLLEIAFSIRAGLWFKIGKFEVLWEDVARATAVGFNIVFYMV